MFEHKSMKEEKEEGQEKEKKSEIWFCFCFCFFQFHPKSRNPIEKEFDVWSFLMDLPP